MALACPVDKRIKGYPFEVVLKVGGRTVGAVLADRVEPVAWRTRRVERVDAASPSVVREVAELVAALVILRSGPVGQPVPLLPGRDGVQVPPHRYSSGQGAHSRTCPGPSGLSLTLPTGSFSGRGC